MLSYWKNIEKYKVHHIVFWFLYAAFWIVISDTGNVSLESIIFINAVYMVASVGATYTSMYSLIPFFLDKKKYAMFTLLQVLNISVFSGLIILAFYVLLKDNTEALTNMMQPQIIYPASFGSVVTTVFFTSMIKLIRQRIKNEDIRKNLEIEKYEAELTYLKGQINPHFLFNTLNNIYHLIHKDADLAANSVLQFSELLRFTLYDVQKDKILLNQELEYIQDYIKLELLRKSDTLELNIERNISDELNDVYVAPLLLIPLVENAFKYVSENEHKKYFINMKINFINDTLIFGIENAYKIKEKSTPTGFGIGLENLKKRLMLEYPDKHILSVHSNEGVFAVNLELKTGTNG